jgi:hypothetical protein
MNGAWFMLVCLLGAALASPASASIVAETRYGVAAHNVRFNDAGEDGAGQSNERGPALQFEVVAAPVRLGVLGEPRPYAMVSANLNGDTSYAAAGLAWRWRPARRWTVEASFGVAAHDGALRNRYPPDDPRADAYARSHQLLGKRVLFRESLALDREIDQRRSIGLVFEHLSNGGSLFRNADNQSLNEIALRFTVRH